MARITKINHVAIVVPDVNDAVTFWRDTLGLDLVHIEEVSSQQSMVAFFPVGDSDIELVKPLTEGSGIAKFLAEKGPGMHHLCFEVDDLDGMLAGLKQKGIRLVNELPVILPGRKVAFIHPKASNGVLVELSQAVES
jgi:methylmalonyl-CoA/ethylmalonyl-CoA epimerase